MTTILTTTRLWESEDSTESIDNRFRGLGSVRQTTKTNSTKEIKFPNPPQDHQSKNIVKKKSGKSVLSRTSVLAVPKRNLTSDQISGFELNGVKKTALLYEITDRTNRLAKPKMIANDLGKMQNPPSRISLPKIVSQRVSELSRPRIFYNPPTKPSGYIAPCALRAVATQRILELAKPRKTTRSPRSLKRNIYAVINAPCSSRISYLARPKHCENCGGVRKKFLKRSSPMSASGEANPTPWEYPGTRVWKELGYSENVVKSCEKEYRSRNRRRCRPRKQRQIKSSKSNDTVLSLSVKRIIKSRNQRTKKFCLSNKMNRIMKRR